MPRPGGARPEGDQILRAGERSPIPFYGIVPRRMGRNASAGNGLHVTVVPIGDNPAIAGYNCHVEVTRRRDDQTVSGVSMQFAGKK